MVFEIPLDIRRGLCNRCGLCCKLPSGKDCPNLIREENGLTKCKVFPHHVGTRLPEGVICSDIMKVEQLFKDCPFNMFKDENGKPKNLNR